jgi:hypothetical protein
MTRRAVAVLAVLAACAAALTGCVERRMVIRSQPEGARVLVDLEEIEGRTPVEVPFEWSGTREVVLLAPGYEVLEGRAELEDRWFSYFPLDLFAELLYPGTIHDVQEFDFELVRYHPVDEPLTAEHEAELERRLAELRARADAHRRGGSDGPADEIPPDGKPGPGDDVPPPPSGDDPPPPPPRAGP